MPKKCASAEGAVKLVGGGGADLMRSGYASLPTRVSSKRGEEECWELEARWVGLEGLGTDRARPGYVPELERPKIFRTQKC